MFDFFGRVMLMNDDIGKIAHSAFYCKTDQNFIDAYTAAHLAKFGEEFAIN